MEYFVISAKFVPLKYHTLSSQLRRLTSFSVGLFGSANSVTRSYPVMRKSCIGTLSTWYMLVLHAFLLHVPFWVLFQQMQWMYRYNDINKHDFINKCGIGPLLVLVFPCFRENVVVTCKIESFLCSLDNLLQKIVFVSFLKIKFQNGTHLKKKGGYFWSTFHIF